MIPSQHIRRFLFIFLFGVMWLFAQQQTYAQGERKLTQLSGIVVDGDSSYGVPGVHVYIPRAGRGTSTNNVGFFTLPTLVGDTVVFSAVGFKKHNFIVPNIDELGITILVDLHTDTTFLPVVEVFPYPTVELFKEAFLTLELPDEKEAITKNMKPEELTRMAAALPMDGAGNHRFYMNQYVVRSSNRYFAPTFSFLNPFAWAEFIRSVKNGDLKSDKSKKK